MSRTVPIINETVKQNALILNVVFISAARLSCIIQMFRDLILQLCPLSVVADTLLFSLMFYRLCNNNQTDQGDETESSEREESETERLKRESMNGIFFG